MARHRIGTKARHVSKDSHLTPEQRIHYRAAKVDAINDKLSDFIPYVIEALTVEPLASQVDGEELMVEKTSTWYPENGEKKMRAVDSVTIRGLGGSLSNLVLKPLVELVEWHQGITMSVNAGTHDDYGDRLVNINFSAKLDDAEEDALIQKAVLAHPGSLDDED